MFPIACIPKVSGSSVPALPAGATARWDASALAGSDGDLIATFSDTIGTNNGTAAGSARATLKTGGNGQNGRNILRFDGVANSYTLGGSISGVNTYTIAAVMKRTGSDMCPLGTSNFLPGLVRSATGVTTGDASNYAVAADVNTGWEIVVAGREANASFGSRNGSVLTFGSNLAFATAAVFSRLGSRSSVFSNGDFADIVYWPAKLTALEIADVCANLNAKWGVY